MLMKIDYEKPPSKFLNFPDNFFGLFNYQWYTLSKYFKLRLFNPECSNPLSFYKKKKGIKLM